jgi:hypothetical protein
MQQIIIAKINPSKMSTRSLRSPRSPRSTRSRRSQQYAYDGGATFNFYGPRSQGGQDRPETVNTPHGQFNFYGAGAAEKAQRMRESYQNPQTYTEPITMHVGPGQNQPTRYGGVYHGQVNTYGGAPPGQSMTFTNPPGSTTHYSGGQIVTTPNASGGTTTTIYGGTHGFVGGHFYGGHYDGNHGRRRR